MTRCPLRGLRPDRRLPQWTGRPMKTTRLCRSAPGILALSRCRAAVPGEHAIRKTAISGARLRNVEPSARTFPHRTPHCGSAATAPAPATNWQGRTATRLFAPQSNQQTSRACKLSIVFASSWRPHTNRTPDRTQKTTCLHCSIAAAAGPDQSAITDFAPSTAY